MNLKEVRRAVEDIKTRYRDSYSKSVEEAVRGEVKFVEVTLRFKVDNEKKSLDFRQ